MGSEWINTELGDVIELKRGYDLPKTKRISGSVPVVSSSGHSGLHNEVKIKSPGVVTGRYGTIGQVFYIEEDFWPLNTTLYVKDFKGNDPLFIYYYLKTVSYKDYTDKGAVPGVNRNDLHRAKVSVPKCPKYQNKLATHLRDLDKKITLNNQINQTLEQIAQTLFKSWFVDFDLVKAKMNGEQAKGMDAATASLFPEKLVESELGLIPEGWKVDSLGNYLDVLETGKRPKGGVKGITEGIPSVGAENILGVGNYKFGKEKFIPEELFLSLKKGVVESEDVLIYKDGGKPGDFKPRFSMFGYGFPYKTFAINEHVFRIRSNKLGQPYLYCQMRDDYVFNDLRNKGAKAAIPGINQKDVKSMLIVVPNESLLSKFNDSVASIFEMILKNSLQSQELAKLRDTLLPKLLSGEIDLENLQVEQANALAE
ncbi:type I restriction endonuclease subunit S [Vibrio lentus]|uniref:restriction endonuclease subunit S n=1 Tax=Vibrio lentus TaxID=136468 RepID=UPI000C821525|nr:restriction endonuclease subunit S [Vibrio lentus]MCC4817234.1 restriction endonuclease subunit S [Vibrio lentus]PMG73231.1 type I restriction endonuclease subunit S [Vibrio lentus]PMK91082.1 type I restriction endonuclease subunit S [Vibrio lentus]PML22115.1 type I restriction endonuclease subunit S [Vibrio lentus]PMM29413.1 type I restriction endonuclease subunit S [Vibrio lentus]